MQKNMGRTDRSLRALVAVGAVVASGLLGSPTAWGIVLLVVANALPQARAPASCAAAALVGLLVAGLDSLLFLMDGQGNGASYVGIGEVGIEIEEEPRWA